jgi:hypothetical protein
MVRRKLLQWIVVIVLGSIASPGCFNLANSPGGRAAAARPRPDFRPTADRTSGQDLRIPKEAVAQVNEIPLVPVPPPPLGNGAAPRTPAPAPTTPPVIATTPAAQVPPSSPPTPVPPVVTTATAPSAVPPASFTPPAITPPHTARQILQQALASFAPVDSYIARLTRRELTKGKYGPEEVLLFKFRKQPWSIHFKWLGEVARGREVVYVKGQHENKIHTLLAAGDAPLMPAGKHIALAPDSVFARSASRHAITEAGIGSCLEHLTGILDAQERGDRRRGTLSAIPPINRPEFNQPVEAMEYVIPPGVEPELPRGGRRMYGIDPDTHLPLLIITLDDRGQEVEYYRYDRLQLSVRLDDDDFNPDKLWASPKSDLPSAPGNPGRR